MTIIDKIAIVVMKYLKELVQIITSGIQKSVPLIIVVWLIMIITLIFINKIYLK